MVFSCDVIFSSTRRFFFFKHSKSDYQEIWFETLDKLGTAKCCNDIYNPSCWAVPLTSYVTSDQWINSLRTKLHRVQIRRTILHTSGGFGGEPPPPTTRNVLNFMQFLETLANSCVGPPWTVDAPSCGKSWNRPYIPCTDDSRDTFVNCWVVRMHL